jgi:hypothetical protein
VEFRQTAVNYRALFEVTIIICEIKISAVTRDQRQGHCGCRQAGDPQDCEGVSVGKAKAEAFISSYAGHSLRAGLATSAAEANVPGHLIRRQMRHKRFDTTTRYIRKGQIFKQNAAAMVGL